MRFRIHSCVLLTLVFLLALTACSVETREERQQRLDQESGQVADQPDQAAQDGATQDSGAQDSGAQDSDVQAPDASAPDAAVDAAPDTAPDTVLDTTPDTIPDATPDASPDAAAPDGQDAAAPDALTQDGPEFPMPLVSEPEAGVYDTAMQALDQHPEAVVHAFFTQVMNGDLALLEPLVAKDQRQELKDLLAYLEEQKNLPEDPLQGVDKVDVMQTSLTAVVDVNVTVRLKSGPRTTAESIELVYEDGAWRLSSLDF